MNQSTPKNRFRKTERLCSKKLIDKLFNEGEAIYVSPVKTVWIKSGTALESRIQVLVVVPKKNIRKAVDRNYLKRLIREVYRKNKHTLASFLEKKQEYMELAFIYTGKNVIEYPKMESTILLTLERLIKVYEETAG